MRRPLQLVALTAIVSLFAFPAAAQSVDEIVSKNLQAKGGLDLLRQTNSVKMTGTFTTLQPPAAVGDNPTPVTMPMTTWAKRPNFVRREVEITAPAGQSPARGPSRPMKMISAADGSTVWMQQGTNPPVELPAAQASQMLQNSEFDSVFVAYRDKDVTIDLVGVEKVNGKDTYHLAVRRKDGPVQEVLPRPRDRARDPGRERCVAGRFDGADQHRTERLPERGRANGALQDAPARRWPACRGDDGRSGGVQRGNARFTVQAAQTGWRPGTFFRLTLSVPAPASSSRRCARTGRRA